MTVSLASIRDTTSKGIPEPLVPLVNYTFHDWYRTPSWLPLPSVSTSESKVVGLYRVDKVGSYIAVRCTCAVGTQQYTIDWGDGTVDTVQSNTVINHEFVYTNSLLDGSNAPVTFTASTSTVNRTNHGYSNGMTVNFYNIVSTTGISAGAQYYVVNSTANTFQVANTQNGSPITLTNDGSAALLEYKQSVVTITPVGAAKLTTIDFGLRHTVYGSLSVGSTGWLDLLFSGIEFTSLSSTQLPNTFLEQAQFISDNSCVSFNSLFANASNLQSIPKWVFRTFGGTVTVSSMFANCVKLRKLPEFANFNTDRISNATSMFSGCISLITVPAYSWTNCGTFSNMFASCYSLQSVGSITNTNSITGVNGMFQSCYSLRVAPFFDTPNCDNFQSMFLNCYSLESVPLYNTIKNVFMNSMFAQCYRLTEIPLFNTSNVIQTTSAFAQCRSLTEVPLFDTSKVTNISSMFNNCHALRKLPTYNTSNVTTTAGMFDTCYSLVEVPLFDTSKVTDMSGMFIGCSSLSEIPPFNTSNVTNMANLFNSAFSTASTLKELPLFDTSKVTNMRQMFRNTPIQTIPAFNTSNVTDFQSMFINCPVLQSIPKLDTSKAITVGSMFDVCPSLNSIPDLNFSNATTLGTFTNCVNCTEMKFTGAKISINISNSKLFQNGLEEVFNNLSSNTVAQTLTITNAPGATIPGFTIISRASCSTVINTADIVNTGIQAAGVTVGMYATGTNITNALTVTVTAGTDLISHATLALNPPIGTRVSFTTTANGITQYQIYYVITQLGQGTFQISATPGGAPLDITGTGTMTMNYENPVQSVSTNGVVLSWPAQATGSTTIAFRKLNTNIPRLKNWIVTG